MVLWDSFFTFFTYSGEPDMTWITIAILGAGVLVTIIIIGKIISTYNRFVSLENEVENEFADIETELKRRHDLIPNLVETAQGYMDHESETLQNVTEARNQAVQARERAAEQPTDGGAMEALAGAESMLQGALSGLQVAVEDYPELKANENMQQLMDELSEAEDRIASRRQSFNNTVKDFNTAQEIFPNNIIAGFFRFTPAEFFEIEDESEREAPDVSFS